MEQSFWTTRAWIRPLFLMLGIVCGWTFGSAPLDAEEASTTVHLSRVLDGSSPAGIDELKALQARIQELTPRILSCTVAIQVGRANGSGVIVSELGDVLTAAHVVGTPNRAATILLPDGRIARGRTLGLNQELDAGMIRISDAGPWPFAPLGESTNLRAGQWCLATGHPGGFTPQRLPVLRFGRILKAEESALLTDCTLVGGDSGGPLFDLEGRVIGIHSRIGKNLTINVHVPIAPYEESWDRLARGEVWGLLENDPEGWLGVTEDSRSPQARVLQVVPGSPAERAGLKPGDLVVRLAEAKIDSFGELQQEVRKHPPGKIVELEVRRENKIHELRVELGRRP
jgi:serine protease Do